MKNITSLAALLAATLSISPSYAQSGFILEPTHTLTAVVEVDTQFTTGAWMPSAPSAGGPGTVLRLDIDGFTTGGTVSPDIENDFTPMVYDLSGLVLDNNNRHSNRTSHLLRPAGASWRFVSSGGLDPRIEKVNSGEWELEAPMEFANDVTYFSSRLSGGLSIEGAITGTGGFIVDGTQQDYRINFVGSTLYLNAQASYTGPTIIRARGLDIFDAGSLTATSSITVEPAGRLVVRLGQNPLGNRIGDTIPVTLAGGALSGSGGNTSYTETLGDVTLARATSSQVAVRSYDGEFALNSLTRQRHATLSVYGDSPIRGVGGVVTEGAIHAGGALPLVGGAGAAGTTSISIVPYMAGHSNQNSTAIFAKPNSLVTLDPNNNFRVLDRSTELQVDLTPDTLTNANVWQRGSLELLTAPTSVNALVVDFSTIISGPGSLSITSGVLVSSDSDNYTASIGVNDLLFPNDAYVWASERIEVFSDVTVTGDFNKSGLGLLELIGPTTASGGAAFTQGKTDLYGSLDATDHVIVSGGGELEMFPGASLTTPLLEIVGDKARFTMSGGDLQAGAVIGNLFLEGGTFSPAAALETSIDGNLTLFSGSELALDISGTGAGQFDQLDVSGDLLITGDLDLAIGAYTPAPGDEIPIGLVDGTLAGQFAGLGEGDVAATAGNVDLRISYTAGDGNDISLLAVLQGDFDRDNDVDGFDFLFWQRDPSVGLLSDWESNYGITASVAVAAVVPEPSVILMAATASLLLCSHRRRD
ncbi:hypothetical protein [Adhaeretor mobilis]|nr:hypothetical protein [Adhaeretor mobilis]